MVPGLNGATTEQWMRSQRDGEREEKIKTKVCAEKIMAAIDDARTHRISPVAPICDGWRLIRRTRPMLWLCLARESSTTGG